MFLLSVKHETISNICLRSLQNTFRIVFKTIKPSTLAKDIFLSKGILLRFWKGFVNICAFSKKIKKLSEKKKLRETKLPNILSYVYKKKQLIH